MTEHTSFSGDALSRWSTFPTAIQRTGVRHALSVLFDDLAPTRATPPRIPLPRAAIERHRSPHGCILQSVASAVSVSWYPSGETEAGIGELVVIVWRGVVSRPGSARREPSGAVALRQLALRPVEVAPTVWRWQGPDDAVYDGAALAAACRALLDHELGEGSAGA